LGFVERRGVSRRAWSLRGGEKGKGDEGRPRRGEEEVSRPDEKYERVGDGS
jgi:hypothetical protein